MNKTGLIFTIFGATGNLAYNKLFPALYQLYQEEKLNEGVHFVAIGRREKTSEQYRNEVKKIIQKKNNGYTEESFFEFQQRIHYFEMNFSNADTYNMLNEFIQDLDNQYKAQGNRIFYLATSPIDFPTISENLKAFKLLEVKGFKRAVFEKPFGFDLESATEINNRVSAIFGEDNIYRIDHYLGKEMIQNILTVRFSNQIFDSVWNKDAIDNVQITVKENIGVEERGGYYDKSGALRDMVQNHLLQMLAFIAMDEPKDFNTNSIRDEKVKVLKNIQIDMDCEKDKNIVYGQYEGYRQEEKVDPKSRTETYVAIKCEIKHPRWEGVPFYLRTGKFLDSREAVIIIEFKNKDYGGVFSETAQPNLLVIKIQPEEGIYFRINTKKPRSEKDLMAVSMDYCQSCNIAYRSPEAYERLLGDIILGDSTLFTRWDEVETAWRLIQALMIHCQGKECLTEYKKGSRGPEEADLLLAKTRRKWWDIEDLERSRFDF